MKRTNRVKYYGNNDLSASINLHKAEKVIQGLHRDSSNTGINDVLEYCNIILYFDNKVYLANWNDETIKSYLDIVKRMKAEVGRFFSKVDGNNLSTFYEQVESVFQEDFFRSMETYKVFERVSYAQFSKFMDNHPQAIFSIVANEKVVKRFGREIAEQLTDNVEYAELVINHFYVRPGTNRRIYTPKELGKTQYSTIIKNYVNWENANINYLQLIANQKTIDGHSVEDRVRLLAMKKVRNFWAAQQKNEGNGKLISEEILFCNQSEAMTEELLEDQNTYRLKYSNDWIANNLDFATLLNNFIFIFEYVDEKGCCQFLSKPSSLGTFERMLGIHGNNEYTTGVGYKSVQMRSSIQMYAYMKRLSSFNIEIEDLFKWFFEEYLKSEFGVDNYMYSKPSKESSNLEKILLIASQIDAVIKQFRLFVEDARIDRELFEFSSSMDKITSTPSLIGKKYYYACSQELENELFCLFSDQCMLSYLEGKESYGSFDHLVISEEVQFGEYPPDEQIQLKRLLNRGTIGIDNNGYIRIKKHRYHLLSELHENGCIAYSYCTGAEKEIVDHLLEQGELEENSTLFTRQEKDYIDYILNVQQFSNGPELRNKYVHGNYPLDPKAHRADYIELLKIMVLIIIKINEEFCLKELRAKNKC